MKEGETAGDYTSLLATTAQMESVIAGMSEAKQTLKVKLTEANALYTDTENKVGTALFQYKTANRTALNTAIYAAQAVFDNLSSTDDDFTAQTTALTTAINAMSTEINAPDTSKYYFISQQDGSSVDWYLNASATTGTLQPYVSTLPYVMQFEATETGTQFYLKTASGKYITTNNNAWAAIINETAEAWTVAPNDDGSVSFVSTAQSAKLSPWGLTMEWNVDLTTSYANWTVSEATQNSATASVGSAKWATFVAPFEVTLPASVTAYSCTYADGNLAVTETGSQTIAANTPVLLQSETTWSQTFTDYAQYYYNGKPASNSLIGTFLESELPSDGTAYLLQTQDGVTGFYQLTTANISSTANRAYLYIPAAGEARQFIPLFEGETTAIDVISIESSAAEVYSLSGIRTKQMTKGLNIIRTANGQVKKVLR